jgi:hypothetical protein
LDRLGYSPFWSNRWTRIMRSHGGGSLEELIIEAFTRDLQNHLRKTTVTYDRCETLEPLLAKARAAPYDLFLLYLYFGGQPGCSIEIPNASPAELLAMPSETRTELAYITWGGLKLINYLKVFFPTPIAVLTGSGKSPELAALVRQAGANRFLPVPFTPGEFRNAVARCLVIEK